VVAVDQHAAERPEDAAEARLIDSTPRLTVTAAASAGRKSSRKVSGTALPARLELLHGGQWL
jgi:hypothetical protein